MEHQQMLKLMFSYKNATIIVCLFNIITALLLLHGFLNSTTSRKTQTNQLDADSLSYLRESEAILRAMEPVELIKRVREIQQEECIEPVITQETAPKQTAALELSKRLQDFRVMNDANNQKAVEEWLRRKMERAKQQEIDKNVTTTS